MKKQYTSYKETIAFLEQASIDYPNLIHVQSIGETWEGRPIVLATLSLGLENANTKPALLYTGTIHAREWIGIELANSFVQYIIDNHQFNPKLKEALSNNTLYIVPCLNPDGFEFSRTHFSFWRKNRRNNGDGTYGVDLNRNFGTRFKRQTDTNSTTYGGPEAFPAGTDIPKGLYLHAWAIKVPHPTSGTLSVCAPPPKKFLSAVKYFGFDPQSRAIFRITQNDLKNFKLK